jgi:hypothetical protein
MPAHFQVHLLAVLVPRAAAARLPGVAPGAAPTLRALLRASLAVTAGNTSIGGAVRLGGGCGGVPDSTAAPAGSAAAAVGVFEGGRAVPRWSPATA